MSEVKTTAFMVLHAVEALDVMPRIGFRTFWICVVIVDGYSDTSSIVNNYFVFVLLPRRLLFGLRFEEELARRLWRAALFFKPRGSRRAMLLR